MKRRVQCENTCQIPEQEENHGIWSKGKDWLWIPLLMLLQMCLGGLAQLFQVAHGTFVHLFVDDADFLPVFWAHYWICLRKNIWLIKRKLFSFTFLQILLPVAWISPMAFGYAYSSAGWGQNLSVFSGEDESELDSPYQNTQYGSNEASPRVLDLDSEFWGSDRFLCVDGDRTDKTVRGLQICSKSLPKKFVSARNSTNGPSPDRPPDISQVMQQFSSIIGDFGKFSQGHSPDTEKIGELFQKMQSLFGNGENLDADSFRGKDLESVFALLTSLGAVSQFDMEGTSPENAESNFAEDDDAYPEPPAFLKNLSLGEDDTPGDEERSARTDPAHRPNSKMNLEKAQKIMRFVQKSFEHLEASAAPFNDSKNTLFCLKEIPICFQNSQSLRTSKSIQRLWDAQKNASILPTFDTFVLFRLYSRISRQHTPHQVNPSPFAMQGFPGMAKPLRDAIDAVGEGIFITPSNHTAASDFKSYFSKRYMTYPLTAVPLPPGEDTGLNDQPSAFHGHITAASVIQAANRNRTFAQHVWAIIDFTEKDIKIMLNEKILPNSNLKLSSNAASESDHPSAYLSSGFLVLQQVLAEYAHSRAGRLSATNDFPEKPRIVVAPFRAPEEATNFMLQQIGSQFSVSFTMSLLFFFLGIVKHLVEEKECGRESLLRVMGFLHKAYVLSTLTFYVMVGGITSLIVTVILKWTVFTLTPAYVLLPFIVLYTASVVVNSFFLATFFNKSKTAAMVAPLIFFLATLPTMFHFPSPASFASLRHVSGKFNSGDITRVYADLTGSPLSFPATIALLNLTFFVSLPFSSATIFSWFIDLLVLHESAGSVLTIRNSVQFVCDKTFLRYPFLLFSAYPSPVAKSMQQSLVPSSGKNCQSFFSVAVLGSLLCFHICWVLFLGRCMDTHNMHGRTIHWISPKNIPFFRRVLSLLTKFRFFRHAVKYGGEEPAHNDFLEGDFPDPNDGSPRQEKLLNATIDSAQWDSTKGTASVCLMDAHKEYLVNPNSWSSRAHVVLSYLLPFLLFWVSSFLWVIHRLTRKSSSGTSPHLQQHFSAESTGIIKAVDGIDFVAFENEITVLLGANGAGKTTTMAMLTGLTVPTKIGPGSHVYGKAIGDSASGAAPNLIGYCTQGNDALWPSLTVSEHIAFYSVMKEGGRGENALYQNGQQLEYSPEVRELLDILQLSHCIDDCAGTLSGGQKRRLMFLLAFLSPSYSKLIILDEPTAGIDINARHSLWNFLLQMKRQGKTIIISTHYMEEAEVLGDKIVLMKDGKIRAEGSTTELKQRVSNGYLLKISTDPDSAQESHFLPQFVLEFSPSIRLVSDCVGEMQFDIPQSAMRIIPLLLGELESAKVREKFGINCIGISNTTLEEVFLELCKNNTEDRSVECESATGADHHMGNSPCSRTSGLLGAALTFAKTSARYFCSECNPILRLLSRHQTTRHILTLLGKKHRSARRDKIFWFYSLFFPLFLLLLLLTGWEKALNKVARGEFDADSYSPQMDSNDDGEDNPRIWKRDPLVSWPMPVHFDRKRIFPSKGKTRRLRVCPPTSFKPQSPPERWRQCYVSEQKNRTRSQNGYDDNWFYPRPRDDPALSLRQSLQLQNKLIGAHCFCGQKNRPWKESFDENTERCAYATGLILASAASSFDVLWYPSDVTHGPPTILRDLYHSLSPPSEMLSCISYPFRLVKERVADSTRQAPMRSPGLSPPPGISPDVLPSVHSLTISIFLTLPIAFIPPAFLPFLISEQNTGLRHLQALAGVSAISYWLANFLYDMTLLVCCTNALILLVLWNFGRMEYIGSASTASASFALFLLFSSSSLAFVYLISKVFHNPNTGSNIVRVIFSVSGYILQFLTLFLRVSGSKYYKLTHGIFSSLFPTYCLGEGLLGLSMKYVFSMLSRNGLSDALGDDEWEQILRTEGLQNFGNPSDYRHAFGKMVTGNALSCLLLQTCAFSILLLLSELTCWRKWKSQVVSRCFLPASLRLFPDGWTPSAQGIITTKCLTKVYLKWNLFLTMIIHAVKRAAVACLPKLRHRWLFFDDREDTTIALSNFSVTIKSGEKFGFLGINGAGKSTTMRILSQMVQPTFGYVQTGTTEQKREITADGSYFPPSAHEPEHIGYCPQSDCLFDFLTPYEHLRLFFDLRQKVTSAHAGPLRNPVQRPSIALYESITDLLNCMADRMKISMEAARCRERETKAYLINLIQKMQLTTHVNCTNIVEKLSGGNKRRLNGLIALVSTHIWLLDEPSAGLDPIGRRRYWNLISEMRDFAEPLSLRKGHNHVVQMKIPPPTLFLATHHMEEVEAICSRVMIISKASPENTTENSSVLVDGSVLHVKEKLGAGYEIVMHLKEDSHGHHSDEFDRQSILLDLGEALLPSGQERDESGSRATDIITPLESRIGLFRVKIRVAKHAILLSKLFETMNFFLHDGKSPGEVNPWGLVDFTISQSSLESAFMEMNE
ncbi:ABC transporters ABCA family [Perkinsela sp. CCAP 1560/4]|nr:ABC transporters ABCA family [Perkinsela sp. CCAP 1560/4]|eukprot:KNH07266.1 ABC transporters ABCA family [Perkinsela sp. CCAP 1560/4]